MWVGYGPNRRQPGRRVGKIAAGYAPGKLGLASRPDAAVFRGSAGSQRYDLDQLAGVGAVDLPNQIPLPMFETQGWPVVVGSSGGSARGLTRWWGSPGTASNVATESDDEPMSGTGTGTGGAYGSDGGEDCDCRTERGSPLGLGLVALVLCMTRRRRFAA